MKRSTIRDVQNDEESDEQDEVIKRCGKPFIERSKRMKEDGHERQ